MGTELIFSLLISLGLTLVLELGFCALVFKVRGRDILLVALVNVLTNPIVVLTYVLLKPQIGFSPYILTAMLEISAIAVEAVCYKLCGKDISRPVIMSVSANVFSYFIGLLLAQLI